MIIGTAHIRAWFIEGRGGRSGVSGESRIIRGNPPHRIHGAADGVIFGTKVRLKRKFSFFLLLVVDVCSRRRRVACIFLCRLVRVC